MAPKWWKPNKRFIVEVKGGDADGLCVATDDAEPSDAELAISIYRMTQGGELGKAFVGMSVANLARRIDGQNLEDRHYCIPHYYTVVERLDEPDGLFVQIQHRAGDLPPGFIPGTQGEDSAHTGPDG
jgi:hypothetical protein